MGYKIIVFLLFSIFFPATVSAQVIISEIAWMGTSASANDEWMELTNEGSETIDLSGWTLEALDGSPSISLSGTIPSQGTFILERTDDATLPNVPASLIYTGALKNEGEVLILKNIEAEVFRADGSNGWLAGDNTTKETMQWNGSEWFTKAPTPGVKNTTSHTSEDVPVKTSEEDKKQTVNIPNIPTEEIEKTQVSENKEEKPTITLILEDTPSLEVKESLLPDEGIKNVQNEQQKELAGVIKTISSKDSGIDEDFSQKEPVSETVVSSSSTELVVEKPRSIFIEILLLPVAFFKFLTSFFS
jgi:hypothetical protein